MSEILIPVSLGELYDKISILEIKLNNITSSEKIANITKEWNKLIPISEKFPINKDLFKSLKEINQRIWSAEDRLREMESEGLFDDEFIDLARQVYLLNDERSKIKREINLKYNSDIIEEKLYTKY